MTTTEFELDLPILLFASITSTVTSHLLCIYFSFIVKLPQSNYNYIHICVFFFLFVWIGGMSNVVSGILSLFLLLGVGLIVSTSIEKKLPENH